MKKLTPLQLLAVQRAQEGLQRIVAETPASLSGPVLVHALMGRLLCDADDQRNLLTSVALAAAAIAALVEAERSTARGERSVAA